MLKRKIIESCISKHKEVLSISQSQWFDKDLFSALFSLKQSRLKMLIDEYTRKYNYIVIGRTKKGYVIISKGEHIMRYFNRRQITSQMFMSVCYGNITDDKLAAAIYEKCLKINTITEWFRLINIRED